MFTTIWNLDKPSIEEEKKINELLQSWLGKTICLKEYLVGSITPKGIELRNKFILKKILFGQLETKNEIRQLMIASQFNIIYILSSISKIEMSEDKRTIIFYSLNNNGNSVSYTLSNIEEGVD